MRMAAYAQFGYGYPSASQLLVGGGGQTTTTAASAQSPISGANAPSLSPSGGSGTGAPTGALSPGAISQTSNAPVTGSCCENGRPIMTDPVSGQTVCSCQYDSARLALSGYSRIPTGGVGVYGTPYPSTEQNPYPSIGVDSSAFYSPLSNPYGLKESGPTTDMSAWTSAGLQPTTGYYPYDPTLAAYGYGAGYDLAARRKNATRESTATLKAWLNEHKKNPYPTKGEKIMLAIITKMTLTQVSTWFANARRRLKKENKMTWEPKNKTDDDDDAMVSDEEKDKDDLDTDKGRDHKDSQHHVKSELDKDDDDDDLTDDDRKPENLGIVSGHGHMSHHHPAYQHHHHAMLAGYPGIKEELSGPKNQTSSDCGVPIPATKPKIWSLADTAACKTPPPTVAGHHLLGHQQHQQQHPQQQQSQQHQLQASQHHNNQQHGWMGSYQHHHQAQQQQHQHHQQQHNNNPTISAHQSGGNGTTAAAMMNMSGHMTMAGMTQQQQQQHLQLLQSPGHNTNNQQTQSPNHQQQQQHHHQQQQQQQQQHNHQMNMMNNFGNSPYSRYGGFLGATTIPTTAQQMYHSNNMIGTTNQNTPITPTTTIQQTTQQQQQLQHQQQQQSMGFPEVQTDTPPQTPPNMKLPSVAGNLITGSTTPTTGTCYNTTNNNSNSSNNNNSSLNNNNNTSMTNNNLNNGGYSGDSSPSSNGSYVGNFTRIQDQQMMDSPHQDSTAAFKPFFKSQQISNGFVSPV